MNLYRSHLEQLNGDEFALLCSAGQILAFPGLSFCSFLFGRCLHFLWHFVAQNDFMWSGDYFHLKCRQPHPRRMPAASASAGTVATTRRKDIYGHWACSASLRALFTVFGVFGRSFVSTSMAPFVFMSSSINSCLQCQTKHLPLAPPWHPFTCIFMSRRRFIIFGCVAQKDGQCNASPGQQNN